jgi:thiamine-phosphate pyrophosphorylase
VAAFSIVAAYSGAMRARQSLPPFAALPWLWLLTDARNDTKLEDAIRRLPKGSGVVFRHYHLGAKERHTRFRRIARVARACGHTVVLSGEARLARQWGADGSYGPSRRSGGLRLATAHSLREIGAASRAGASAVLLSPAFPTRSHPAARTLGPVRFRLLALRAPLPVIALGGMTRRTARRLGWRCWAAIDGLS